MCEPTLIAAGVGAAFTVAQGVATKNAADQQASNLRLQGRQQLQAGNVEANQSRQAASRELGAVRAKQSASGVDLSSGSPADVGGRIAGNLEMDALMKLYHSRLGKWQSDYGAKQSKAAGKAALTGSVISAGTSLLGAGATGGYFDSMFGDGLSETAKKARNILDRA